MRVYQRNGSWWYDFTHKGRRYRQRAGEAATKDQAERLGIKRERELIDAEIYGTKPEAVKFADFADEFWRTDCAQKRSQERDRGILEMFKVHRRGRDLDRGR